VVPAQLTAGLLMVVFALVAAALLFAGLFWYHRRRKQQERVAEKLKAAKDTFDAGHTLDKRLANEVDDEEPADIPYERKPAAPATEEEKRLQEMEEEARQNRERLEAARAEADRVRRENDELQQELAEMSMFSLDMSVAADSRRFLDLSRTKIGSREGRQEPESEPNIEPPKMEAESGTVSGKVLNAWMLDESGISADSCPEGGREASSPTRIPQLDLHDREVTSVERLMRAPSDGNQPSDGGPLTADQLQEPTPKKNETATPGARLTTPKAPNLSKSRAERRMEAKSMEEGAGDGQQEEDPGSMPDSVETRRKKRLGKSKARLLNLTKELNSIESLLKNRKEGAADSAPTETPPPPPEGAAIIDASGSVTGRPADPELPHVPDGMSREQGGAPGINVKLEEAFDKVSSGAAAVVAPVLQAREEAAPEEGCREPAHDEEHVTPHLASQPVTSGNSLAARESPKLADDLPDDDEAGPLRLPSDADLHESRPSTSAEIIDESVPKNRRGGKKINMPSCLPDDQQAWGMQPAEEEAASMEPDDLDTDQAGPLRLPSNADLHASRPSTSAEIIDESVPKNRRAVKKTYVSPRTPDAGSATKVRSAKSKQSRDNQAPKQGSTPAPPSGASSRPKVPPRSRSKGKATPASTPQDAEAPTRVPSGGARSAAGL